MPIAALARLFSPSTSVLAQVPVDDEDVSVLALRLQEAKLLGNVTLETIRLITLEHQVQAAKKAKATAKKVQEAAALAQAQAAAHKQAAAANKKAAHRRLRSARGHRAVHEARMGRWQASDHFLAAHDVQKQAKEDLRRAKAAHRAASQADALVQPGCLGSPSWAAASVPAASGSAGR